MATKFVSSSGWEADEVEKLDRMVQEERTDRSKFLRGLVRKEWEERARLGRILAKVSLETRKERAARPAKVGV